MQAHACIQVMTFIFLLLLIYCLSVYTCIYINVVVCNYVVFSTVLNFVYTMSCHLSIACMKPVF